MNTALFAIMIATTVLAADKSHSTHWPAPKAEAIPEADGYVEIADAAIQPEKSHIYRAIFDATRGADNPTQLVPVSFLKTSSSLA